MTKEQFGLIKAYLTGAYNKFDVDSNVWFDYFKSLNFQVAITAVKDYVRANKFPPTISGILNIYHSLFEDFYRLPLDQTILKMRNAGYFNSPMDEPTHIIDGRMYQANKWLYSGIMPTWFLSDYQKYKNKKIEGDKRNALSG